MVGICTWMQCTVVLVALVRVRGQHHRHRDVNVGNGRRREFQIGVGNNNDPALPDLKLPGSLEEIADLGGGPEHVAALDFNPEGVVQGIMIGDVLRRIDNLEILCQAKANVGSHGTTPSSLFMSDSEGGLKLHSSPQDATLRPLVVPGPESETKLDSDDVPTAQQLQRTMDLVQESVLTLAYEQDKLREELNHVLSEVTTVKQEMAEVTSGIRESRSEVMSAVRKSDDDVKAQGEQISKLVLNVTNIDMALDSFHKSYYELASMNRSILVAMKVQRHTDRKLDGLTKDMRSLKKVVGDVKERWNKTMKETERRLQRSYTVGKDINKLQKQFHSMKAKVTKVNEMKCVSGSQLFMNYPFSFGKWPQSRVIKFSRPFSRTPQITFGMTQLDVNYRYNTRARVRVMRKTPQSFTLVVDGWYNTRLYRVEVSWMACVV